MSSPRELSPNKEAMPHNVPQEPEIIDDDQSYVDSKSPGVARIEAISSVITRTDRIFIFLGVFILAYCYTLDGVLRYAYTPFATASYGSHSLLASINVLRAVIAAAAQPTSAKIADIFGRVELISLSVLFYVVGTIVTAVSSSVEMFAGGAVIYQIGYTMVILLVEVVVADITSTRARLFFSYIPSIPFLINTWVSGNISAAVLARTTWNWGIGMWAIIYPICALPLLITLSIVTRRAKRMGVLNNYKSSFASLGFGAFFKDLFHRLDVIGIILVIAVFALILVPFTVAGGFVDSWREAHIIAPLVIGFICLPIFIIWEIKFARHPLVPFYLMKDRGVWAPLCIASLLNFAWYMQGDYLFTVLIVAFDFTIEEATRITSLWNFCSVLTGFTLGAIVFRVRRLKVFIIAGTCLFMVAFGLLIHFRGDPSSAGRSGVIGAEVLLGIAGGMFPYPAQASLQVGLRHEHLAVMTGLYLAINNIGSAFGNTVSGAIWTQVLPGELSRALGNETLAMEVYADPFTQVAAFPLGTETRSQIIGAYAGTQRLLTITGICLCVPLIGLACALRNPKLNDEQTLAKKTGHEVVGSAENA